MRVTCIGGGPAGLYFAILLRKAIPGAEVRVLERNRPDDTFGWGVVFSRGTLEHFREADPESYAEIERSFAAWDDIDTFWRGEKVTTTGHGFCGLSRRRLLRILHRRAEHLGVALTFETEVRDVEALRAESDLLVGSDGVNSRVREAYAEAFGPRIEWGKCRFVWLGTDLPLRAFTFLYKETPAGLLQVHAYPFRPDRSTFIVECAEEVYRGLGFRENDEEHTVAVLSEIFSQELGGHRLLTNRSIWRRFPTITCERWSHENVVLVGDAAHTAHFSIGSGTKLAMEDAIALARALAERGSGGLAQALAAYEEGRRADVARLQRAAETSRQWFENVARWREQGPIEFTFNQITRSKRITWDNLRLRDPAFVERVREDFARRTGARRTSNGRWPEPAFVPYALRSMELANRVVVAPMCQYMARGGVVGDWHLVHLGSRAIGGAGLVITEMTDVSPEGRITPACAGMWSEEHVEAWRRIVEFVHDHSTARIALQLGHAGRKGATEVPWRSGAPLAEPWPLLAPSPLPWDEGFPVPREMTRGDMDLVIGQFTHAAKRAAWAGFDGLELHMAHGYLLASFLSPLTNVRRDAYGGDLAGRMRFPLEVFEAVRAVWPDERPLWVRISAVDWAEGGFEESDAVAFARALKERGCDAVHVSSGMTVPHASPRYGRMFQVPFSDRIRHEARIPTIAVGNIRDLDQVNTILAAGRADLCALARPHLRDPYLALRGGEERGHPDGPWPAPYLPAKGLGLPRDEGTTGPPI